MKTNKEIIKELKKIKIDHTDSDNDGFNRLCSTEISKIMNIFTQALEQKEREVREKIENNIGYLRQYINERLNGQLITDEGIEVFLELKTGALKNGLKTNHPSKGCK